MKSKNASHYAIGLTVILCSLILLAALTYALSGFGHRGGGRTLAFEFHDATGIKLHSAVKFAGKTAGSVSDIRYLTPEERLNAKDQMNAVRITVQLSKEVPPLPSDISVKLDSETLLGEKFISIKPGRPDSPRLPDGAVIQATESISVDAVTRSARTAVDNVNNILEMLKKDYPELIPRLAELLERGKSLLAQGSNFARNADSTIVNANEIVTKFKGDYDALVSKAHTLFDQAQTIATNADVTVQKVTVLLDRVDGVVTTNEGDVHKLLEELRVVSQNLKVLSTYAKGMSATLAEKPSRLIWGGRTGTLPTEQEILQSKEPVPVERPTKK
jgi:ABC-type transporter Mla subunit MlaD